MQVYWNISDAQSCGVTGTNGDSWTGLASPDDGETSEHIAAQTTYTLLCEAYAGNPNLTETQFLDVAPVYQELYKRHAPIIGRPLHRNALPSDNDSPPAPGFCL